MLQTAAPTFHTLQRVKGMVLHSQHVYKPLERFWQCRSLVVAPLKAPLGSVGASHIAQNTSILKRLRLGEHAGGFRTFASAIDHTAEDSRLFVLNTETLRLPRFCAGCGVELQAEEPDQPGFYQVPRKLLEAATAESNGAELDEDAATHEPVDPVPQLEQRRFPATDALPSGRNAPSPEDDVFRRFDRIVDDWGLGMEEEEQEITVRDLDIAAAEEESDEVRVLCARCYSLSHHGRIKSQRAEAALPQFDLGKKVGRKIGLQRQRRAVVLVVVDAADFDGSLPRAALEGLFSNIEGYQAKGDLGQQASGARDVRLVLAVNKADLLPAQATARRLEAWIRRRAKQGGMPRPEAVRLVSALRGTGVDELLIQLHREVGTNGDVWVVGAQNAGKSSLVNAMRRAVGHRKPREELTTAAMPGTTLGLLKVPGLMPPRCKMFDTPGVPHAHQLSSRLDPEEVKMLLPKKRLKPRTFRAAVGQTVFIGGLVRIDVAESPGATLYITVWASDELICHFGRTEAADKRYATNVGGMLRPPCRQDHSMGPLLPNRVSVQGKSWRESSTDIAIAGLGWVGVGVSGQAALDLWTYKGVAITTREAVLPDFARDLERPGFGSKEQQKKAKGKGKSK